MITGENVIRDTVALMRELNIVSLNYEGLQLTLAPQETKLLINDKVSDDAPVDIPIFGSSNCQCGHPFAQHTDSGCLGGCALEACITEEGMEEASKTLVTWE